MSIGSDHLKHQHSILGDINMFNNGNPEEIALTVKKSDLLSALIGHKEAHKSDYTKAVTVYWRDMKKEMTKRLQDAEDNKYRKDNFSISMVVPEDKTDMYDKYIGFLEMAKEEEMTISLDQYDAYVNDEWDWVRSAKFSNSTYSSRY